jgi:protein-L-isoaspartate(D-aspartate) O-methyltransferase
VFTIELIAELAGQARQRLTRLGHLNIEFRVGDGRLGWPERAPFDKVLVAAAPEVIPPALIEQLKPGGRMVIPAGPPDEQRLMLLQKDGAGSVSMKAIFAVRFSQLDNIAPG